MDGGGLLHEYGTDIFRVSVLIITTEIGSEGNECMRVLQSLGCPSESGAESR